MVNDQLARLIHKIEPFSGIFRPNLWKWKRLLIDLKNEYVFRMLKKFIK
jgi:hypothetical protein